MNKKSIFNSIKIIALGLLLSTGISYAVTPATSNPGNFPTNTYKPVNIGPQNPVTPYQTKAGFLSLGNSGNPAGLVVNGLSSFSGNVNVLGITPPPPPPPPPPSGFNYPIEKNIGKNYLSAFFEMFSPQIAEAVQTCIADFSTNPPSCPGSQCNGYVYNPQTYTCVQPPPTAPTVYIEAITDYGQGPNVTITPSAYAEVDWYVQGSGNVTCTASATPSTGDWTTATTFNDQGLYGFVTLGSVAKSQTRTYTMSCTNSVGTTVATAKINVLTPPALGANLYVSGKACLGNATVNGYAPTCNSTIPASPVAPTASLEVNGNIKIDYLQFGSPSNLCSSSAGLLVLCK